MNAEQLNATHEEYDGPGLAKLRALHEGRKLWHAIAKSPEAGWFPKRWAEPDDVFIERRAMLTYNNHAGGIVEMFAALLFAEAPTIDGLPASEYYAGFLKNVDGKSSSWARWWRERVLDALIGKRAYAWVNAPARPEGVELGSLGAETLAGALDLFLVGLKPEQVINWSEDEAGRLTAVMVKDRRTEWAGPDTGNVTVLRWRFIDNTVIHTWEWKAKKGQPAPKDKEDVPEVLPAITHKFGRIPVVRLELSPGLWAMGKLEDPAVAHMRARNEYTWALHQAANELLTITSKSQDSIPTLGHGHYLQLTRDGDGADEVNYVGPTGVAFDYLQKDVADTRDELFRVVQQMAMSVDQDASQVRQSGESKAQDWKALEVILVSLAAPVLVAMTETLGVIVRARRDKGAPAVSGLDNWQLEDVLTFLENVALADPFIKSETWSKTVALRAAQRILGDEVDAGTMATIKTEVDDADYDPPILPPAPVPLEDEGAGDDGED